jgi:hypothetical protein
MAKPAAVDPELVDIIKQLYRDFAEVGSGSTAAAIRNELATGRRTKGAYHVQKGRECLGRLGEWLKKHSAPRHSSPTGAVSRRAAVPEATPGDLATAENLFLDLKQSLDSGYYADMQYIETPPVTPDEGPSGISTEGPSGTPSEGPSVASPPRTARPAAKSSQAVSLEPPTGTPAGERGLPRGVGTVGGVLFTLYSVGGVIVALSDVHSTSDLLTLGESLGVATGASTAAAALTGSAGLGFIVGGLPFMASDQGPPGPARQRREAVSNFLYHTFTPEQIAKGGENLRNEAEKLLFHTEPVIVADPKYDEQILSLASWTIGELNKEAPSKNVLRSSVSSVLRLNEAKQFAAILKHRPHAHYGEYFNALVMQLKEQLGEEEARGWLKLLVEKGGVDITYDPSAFDRWLRSLKLAP